MSTPAASTEERLAAIEHKLDRIMKVVEVAEALLRSPRGKLLQVLTRGGKT